MVLLAIQKILKVIQIKIKKQQIMTTDMEDFGEWDANVIYFNKKGRVVIAHPR